MNGIAVAAAGAIALQMLLTGLEATYTRSTGHDPSRAQLQASLILGPAGSARPAAETVAAAFGKAEGVRSVAAVTSADASVSRPDGGGAPFSLLVGDCASLRGLAIVDRCTEGDMFLVSDGEPEDGSARQPAPGERFGPADGPGPLWTVPAGAATVRPRQGHLGVFATPSAINPAALPAARIVAYLRLDPAQPDAAEHARNAAARIDPSMSVVQLEATTAVRKFANIRRGLSIGAVATLLLIGASLLVTTLEQLQERRRLLAILVAFGTRRGTLGASVLWQTLVPVLLGLALATAAGAGLGAVLLAMVARPVRLDWGSIATVTAAGAGVMLLVTALSLPALVRMMRPEALRSE